MEFLKSAVASAISQGPPFPYTFGDKVDVDESIWTLYNGTRRVGWPPLGCACRVAQTNDCGQLGGRIKLQHLCLRQRRKEEPAAAREERAAKAADAATPRRHQGSGYGRGMRRDRRGCASGLTVERPDRHIHLHRYRARDASPVARSKEEPESRDHQMGSAYCRCRDTVGAVALMEARVLICSSKH